MKCPVKLGICVNTRTKKILSLRVRTKPTHDINDSKYLLYRLRYKPKKLVADKAYDVDWFHQFCHSKGILACIPIRDYGTPSRHRAMSRRRLNQKQYSLRTYHRRQMVESVFSAIKRKFGAAVSSKSARALRAEIYCRALTHNIISLILDFFNTAGDRTTFINAPATFDSIWRQPRLKKSL